MKQTHMYVCTFEEFILVDLDTLEAGYRSEDAWKNTGLYTLATKD